MEWKRKNSKWKLGRGKRLEGKRLRSWLEDAGGKRLERKRWKEKEREIDRDGHEGLTRGKRRFWLVRGERRFR